jgi:hypothetical protein
MSLADKEDVNTLESLFPVTFATARRVSTNPSEAEEPEPALPEEHGASSLDHLGAIGEWMDKTFIDVGSLVEYRQVKLLP